MTKDQAMQQSTEYAEEILRLVRAIGNPSPFNTEKGREKFTVILRYIIVSVLTGNDEVFKDIVTGMKFIEKFVKDLAELGDLIDKMLKANQKISALINLIFDRTIKEYENPTLPLFKEIAAPNKVLYNELETEWKERKKKEEEEQKKRERERQREYEDITGKDTSELNKEPKLMQERKEDIAAE
jgi:hypothetical protein